MNKLTILDWATLVLLIIGGLNWGLIGGFDFDLIGYLFGPGSLITKLADILVGLSALYLVFVAGKMRRT